MQKRKKLSCYGVKNTLECVDASDSSLNLKPLVKRMKSSVVINLVLKDGGEQTE
jgi:hypothetical protein